MLAYPKKDLENLRIQQQAEDAFQLGSISRQQLENIVQAHPSTLYTPVAVIKTGLGVLTVCIMLFSAGLLVLLFPVYDSFAFFMAFFGFLCYVMLEIMVKQKHYNSGVDNVLLVGAAGLIISGASSGIDTSNTWYPSVISITGFAVSLYLSVRFVDAFMGVTAVTALILCVFFTYLHIGVFAYQTFPFILIAFSFALYYSAKFLMCFLITVHHRNVLFAITVFALLFVYASGNHYVVSTLQQYFTPPFDVVKPVKTSWFFWVWTMFIPICYLAGGILNKDQMILRIGLLLIAPAITTWQFYFGVLSAETMMFIAGLITIAAAYILIKYLHKPKNGFMLIDKNKERRDIPNPEEIVTAEVLPNTQPAAPHTTFGSGSFGGAGAGDQY